LGTATPDPITGQYKLVLPYGKKYGINAQVPGYVAQSQNLDLTDSKGARYLELPDRNIALVPITAGQKVRLENIFFETNKFALQAESFPELNRVVELMNQNPKMVVEIDGHTDSDGSDESNQALSQNRANSVREYLLGKAVKPERIAAKGFGETKPVAANDTPENKQLNRRVEFVIVKN
ncbi:MAG: OmpA family protein, partial [Sphingobacteriaceae bacterium]|nr:OmpA family protein [Cytophagaceae bacterium]